MMRLKRKGVPKSPSIGYGSPKKIRGLHPSGFDEVIVYNVKDLDKVNPERQAIRIANSVGGRKAVDIMDEAEKRAIWVLNPRVILAEEEELEEGLEEGETIKEEDLEELEELEAAEKKPRKKKVEEAPKIAGETELTAIEGINKATAKKLEEIGIFSAEDLAEETEIEELSEIIEVPAEQIKKWVEKAKEITSKKS